MLTLEERTGSAPVRLIVPVTEKFIESSPPKLFASWMAALSVHLPLASRHSPFPGATSGVSSSELTLNVTAARVVRSWGATTAIKNNEKRVAPTRNHAGLVGV